MGRVCTFSYHEKGWGECVGYATWAITKKRCRWMFKVFGVDYHDIKLVKFDGPLPRGCITLLSKISWGSTLVFGCLSCRFSHTLRLEAMGK